MNVLVTGATGFIGGAIARQLHQSGFKVTGTGRNPEKLLALQKSGLTVKRGDLKDATFSINSCLGQQAIIHCAAKVADYGTLRQFLPDTVHATQTVCDAAIKAGVQHFILLSTPSVLFGSHGGENRKESDVLPLNKLAPYARAKLLAEMVVRAASPRMPSTFILRPQAVFGSGETHLFSRLLAANRHRGIPLHNSGEHLIDITAIETVTHAVEKCLHLHRNTLTTINISNNDSRVFRTLIQQLFSACKEDLRFVKAYPRPLLIAAKAVESINLLQRKAPTITAGSLSMILYPRTLDVSFARNIIQLHPPVSINQAIQQFALWWLHNGKNTATTKP